MSQEESHKMVLVTTHTSGAEEWYCPTCGRRFVMHWPPEYKKIVLEDGNEYVAHSCTKGDVSLSLNYGLETKEATESDTSLAPWQAWIDKTDFESLLDQ